MPSDLFVYPADDHRLPVHLAPPRHFATLGGDYSIPFALIRLAVVIIAPFILVDGAIYHLQMLVTGGSAPVTAAFLKIALMGAFGAALVLRGRLSSQPVVIVGAIFVVYLLLDVLHQYFNLGIELLDILLSYNAYYLLPIIGVVALATPVKISGRLLIPMLIILSVICGALGIAQYVTASPIVRTASSDGSFKVLVWSTLGRIRVFSLFTEPAACAVFFCFIASLAVAMSRRRRNLVITIPLLVMSLFLSWASGARTNIIATVCGVVSAWIITFLGGKGRAKWLPFCWLAVGLLIAVYAYFQTSSGSLSTGSMADASSISERFTTWANILEMFRSTSALNLLIGYGLVQNSKIDPAGLGLSDNLYLATVLHIGLIGLCLMMLLLWNLWQVVRKEAEMRTSFLTIAVAATYSTLLLTGLFKINSFGMIFLFFAISERATPFDSGKRKPA
jgi:hypothetical protein